MAMNASTQKVLATAVLAVAGLVPVCAASAPPEEQNGIIRKQGDGAFFLGDCSGKTVQLTGDRQNVTLLGTCATIYVEGNGSRITFDGATALKIVGDGNVIRWTTKPKSVSIAGGNNSLTGAFSSPSK
jgi:hypothetical protein